ncbi:MAG: 50S ribosomal protein L24 [Candidatus Bathyarchaeia archaeon]
MVNSSKPSAQRKMWYNMPKHISKKKVTAHLNSELRSRYGRRSISVRRGDRVVILKGDFRGVEGEVMRVDRGKGRLFIEGASRENARGERVLAPISPSNVIVVKLYEDDKRRFKAKEKSQEASGEVRGAG